MSRKAFTLIELLVVVGIVAVLMAIMLPALSSVIESARQTHCASNLRSLGFGLSMYMESGDDMLPYARWAPDMAMERDAPFDIIGSELGVSMPMLVADEYIVDQPFMCNSDRVVSAEVGFSYLYAPFSFFAVLPEESSRRVVTRMFTTNTWSVLFQDRFGYHDGEKNIVRSDGAVEIMNTDRGLGIYDP